MASQRDWYTGRDITKGMHGHGGVQVGGAPPYSPDLALANFFLFPTAKNNLADIPNNGESAKIRWAQAISTITQDDFAKVMNKWMERWDKAIERQGDYVEKLLLNKFL